MSVYEVRLIDDVGSILHSSQHDQASASLWLQIGRYDDIEDDRLLVLDEGSDEPTSLDDRAYVVLTIQYPTLMIEALRPDVKVQPRGVQPQSANPWQLLDLVVSSNTRRIFTYLRPDDQITVAGYPLIIDATPKPRTPATDGEQVQVNSSIPGLDGQDANDNTNDFQDRLGFGRFNAPALVPRSKTPTQASNGPTVEETPANHQRHVDAEARPQRQRSSQLYDSLHRNHVPSDALISSPHHQRSPIKFEDEESQSAVNYSTATSTMQPPQGNGPSKPEQSEGPDAPAIYEDLDDEPEVEATDDNQPENDDVSGAVDELPPVEVQQNPDPGAGEPDMETSPDGVDMHQAPNEPIKPTSVAEPPKRFEGTLADAGDDEQTESEDETDAIEPLPPNSSGAPATAAKAVSPIDGGKDVPDANKAPPAKRGRKRKAVSEGKAGNARKRRSNSAVEAEKETPARGVSVVVKSARKKAKASPSPPSSANSTRKSPRQQSANGDANNSGDQFDFKRVAFSNSSVTDIISVKKFFSKKSLKQVDKLTNKNYDILVVGTGEMKKTSKLLKSLLLRKPIATEAWLLQSEKAGRLLDPSDFNPADLDADTPRDTLLSGKHVVITEQLKTEYGSGYREVAELAKLAGAESVTSKPTRGCKSEPDESIVLGLEKEDLEARNFFEHGYICYTKDLLSTSILRGELRLDDDEFKMKMSSSQAKKARSKPKGK